MPKSAASQNKRRRNSSKLVPASRRETGFSSLPEDIVLLQLSPLLSYPDLVALGAGNKSLSLLTAFPPLWKSLFIQRWGAETPLRTAAARHAGGWKALFQAKHECEKSSAAASALYRQPCCYEIEAQLHALAHASVQVATAQQHVLEKRSTCSSSSSSSSSACSSGSHGSVEHGSLLFAVQPVPFPHRLSPPPQQQPWQSNVQQDPTVTSPSNTYGFSVPYSYHLAASPPYPSLLSTRSITSQTTLPPPACAQIIFLIDGSGSVSADEFREMRSCAQTSAHILCSVLQGGPDDKAAGKVAVVQFSHEPRVELELTELGDGLVLKEALDKMVHINGGTNIEAALDKARHLFDPRVATTGAPLPHAPQSLSPPTSPPPPPPPPPPSPPPLQSPPLSIPSQTTRPPPRLVILLTDGRVDGYQARGARAAAKRLASMGGGCVLAAFGVGRGVDEAELIHIIEPGAGPDVAKERYLDLFVRDDDGSW